MMDVKLCALRLATGGKKWDFYRQVCDLQITLCVSGCARDGTRQHSALKNLLMRSEAVKGVCFLT